jgi:hypothetical protein
MREKTKDKIFEFTLYLIIFGILIWFTVGSGLAKLVYYIITGRI